MTAVDLTGRRVLVTGASSGIGESICRALTGCGAAVAMLARRKERLDELATEPGERAFGVDCDVTGLDYLAARVDEAVRCLGGLDAVVTVAGRGMVGTIVSGTPQAWRDLLDLNLVGLLATVRYPCRTSRRMGDEMS
jgi:NADP-dependent 3-hydroxy acid dehydrogenase YdfG